MPTTPDPRKLSSNPDRVRAAKIPKGWRLLTIAEKNSKRRLRIRIWEPTGRFEESPDPHWGPVITARIKPTAFTAIRRA